MLKIDAKPPRVKIKKSQAGLGLYALDDIKKGQLVIEYKGPILNNQQADEKGGKYLFEVNSRKTIDGSSRKNLARYINHSCRPNCEPEIKNGRVFIMARRNIKAGEELHYDYGTHYFKTFIKPHGCRCEKCESNSKIKNQKSKIKTQNYNLKLITSSPPILEDSPIGVQMTYST